MGGWWGRFWRRKPVMAAGNLHMKWDDALRSVPVSGASDAEIRSFVESVFAPLTESEIRELIDEHQKVVGEGRFDPPFSPHQWILPKCPLPTEYLDFLQWSNGGYFEGTDRDLDPLFSTKEVRDYMLGYSVPHWMPEACPIGFDGGGGFYLLDMRLGSTCSHYPVIWAHAGNLGFEDSKPLAASFAQFIASRLGA